VGGISIVQRLDLAQEVVEMLAGGDGGGLDRLRPPPRPCIVDILAIGLEDVVRRNLNFDASMIENLQKTRWM